MPNPILENALRGFLTASFAVPNANITRYLDENEIKESFVQTDWAVAITAINANRAQFVTNLENALTGIGVVITASNTYDFSALGLTGPVAATAPEDFNAIKTHANNLDAAKALTNILRAIKVCPRT